LCRLFLLPRFTGASTWNFAFRSYQDRTLLSRTVHSHVSDIYTAVPIVWHHSRLAMVQRLLHGVCSSAVFTRVVPRASALKIVIQLQCSCAYNTPTYYSTTPGTGKGTSPACGFRPTSKPP
jgi:hypothetical protein